MAFYWYRHGRGQESPRLHSLANNILLSGGGIAEAKRSQSQNDSAAFFGMGVRFEEKMR
ncbi:hypothetical protein [Coleofasciculus sp. FACHB-129]|uniref:hypothetical protein n=1 Tax=Cyanophyceae TaxID=3028117 RepID=UPI00168562E0|nr:hypothetical protein [Coleofasciculus sp. FACHB-129]MBD1895026.1 hypothetical protein [Coleofasciculus sp. FACHB-129]